MKDGKSFRVRIFIELGSFKAHFDGSSPFQRGYFRVTSCVKLSIRKKLMSVQHYGCIGG